MKRKHIRVYSETTEIAPDGSIAFHWSGYRVIPKPLPWDKPLFEAFKAAILAGEDIDAIAERFEETRYNVRYYQWKLGVI